MTITPMTVLWILLGIAVVVGFAVLISRQMKAGKDVGVPTSVRADTHDLPPSGSDAAIQEEQHHAHDAGERKPDEFVDIHRTHGA